MPRAQSADFLEKIVPSVRTGGARNIVEIARALHMPVETARYKVRGMLRRGLTIHAGIDYNKFGLTNHEAYFVLGPGALSNEKKFFQILADYAYLTSYSTKLPDNGYVCSFATPYGTSNLMRLTRELIEEGYIETSRIERLSWKKCHMIQPSFFQVKRGLWQIDWNRIKKDFSSRSEKLQPSFVGAISKPSPAAVASFDEVDLMIARYLEQDALIKLTDIADLLKTTLNNVFYHFHKHIIADGLVEEFLIRWNGTPKQESILTQFEFGGLTTVEEKNAQMTLRRLPFLWFDALSNDTGFYIAEAMIPTYSYLQCMQYLSQNLGEASKKLKVNMLDPKARQQFPMPAHLFKDQRWEFDPDTCINQVVSKIKK